VYDWRVHAAANGLSLAADTAPTSDIVAEARNFKTTRENYAAVRNWLLATATATGEHLSKVERALYTLSQSIPADAERTWRDYAMVLTMKIEEAAD
jgi:hypothetical protein